MFPPIHKRHLAAVIFSLKAAIGAVVAALVYQWLALPGGPWVAAVSAVLVTQPDLDGSLKASLLRVAANLAGAFGGAVLLEIIGQPIVAMAVGVMLTGLVCYLLEQDDADEEEAHDYVESDYEIKENLHFPGCFRSVPIAEQENFGAEEGT